MVQLPLLCNRTKIHSLQEDGNGRSSSGVYNLVVVPGNVGVASYHAGRPGHSDESADYLAVCFYRQYSLGFSFFGAGLIEDL